MSIDSNIRALADANMGHHAILGLPQSQHKPSTSGVQTVELNRIRGSTGRHKFRN